MAAMLDMDSRRLGESLARDIRYFAFSVCLTSVSLAIFVYALTTQQEIAMKKGHVIFGIIKTIVYKRLDKYITDNREAKNLLMSVDDFFENNLLASGIWTNYRSLYHAYNRWRILFKCRVIAGLEAHNLPRKILRFTSTEFLSHFSVLKGRVNLYNIDPGDNEKLESFFGCKVWDDQMELLIDEHVLLRQISRYKNAAKARHKAAVSRLHKRSASAPR